jgi:hypothetical protein
MKYLIQSLILIFILFGCGPAEVPQKVLADIDSIVYRYIPDKREAIWDVNLALLKDKKLLIRGETSIPEAKSGILNYFAQSGIEFTDSLKILPDPSEIKNSWGLISVSICNMKKDPSHSGELVSQAIMGTPVKIMKKSGSWLLVQTPDYYIGWITASGLREKSEDEFSEWKKSDRVIFTSKSGEIFSESPGTGVISDAVAGIIVNKVAERADHFVVELPDGRGGRINKKDGVEFGKWCSEVKPEAGKLVSFARSVTGTSYLWGGTSTKMADCSGFVKTVYFTGGIILARDASQQFLYGNEVDISSSFDGLMPGDLLFFGSLNTKGEKRITHTGLFLGDTEFIHSSVTNGMVWNNSLDSTRSDYNSYLVKILMGARRIIGAETGKGIHHIKSHNWYL